MTDWIYHSHLSPETCRNRLMDLEFNNDPHDYYAYRYECNTLSGQCMHLIFRGMQRVSKAKRTEYVVVFFPEGAGTRILLRFHRELFGLPAMTAIQELDDFLFRKLRAVRTDTPDSGNI